MTRDSIPSAGQDSAVLRVWEILRRRRMIALLVFAMIAASAVSFARYLPDLYQASAIVLVERQALDVRPSAGTELESRLHVIKQEILSRSRLTDLIERFNLYEEERRSEPLESVLEQTRKDIRVEPNGPEQIAGRTKTVAFRLTYTGEDRVKVADVTNAIAAFYVAQNDRMRSEEATRTTEFLTEQLAEAKKALDRQEDGMRAFTSRHIGELPQQVGVNLATLERLNDQLRLNGEQQLKVLDQRERLLEGLTLEGGVPASAASSGLPAWSSDTVDQTRRLDQMKQELQKLEAQFTPRHPDVIRLKDQIAVLEKDLEAREAAERRLAESAERSAEAAKSMPPARRRALEGLNADLERLKTSETDLRRQIATFERRLESTPERQQDIAQLTRDHQAAKDNYDFLAKRLDEAQLAESMETDRQGERFRILEPAVVPDGPSAPNRLRLLILGLLLAVGAAAAAVMAAEQIDTSFHNVDELRDFTAVPVLATIPHIGPRSGGRVIRLAMATASAVVVIAAMAALSAYLASGNEHLVRLLVRAS
jgi:protein tyrosine kinase modulator